MKNILMICPFARPNMGGVESHLDKLLDFLAKKKVYVYLLTYQPLSLPVRGQRIEKGKNFEIHRFDWFGVGWFNKFENSFPLTFVYLFPGLFVKSFIFFAKRSKQINCIHAHGFAAAAIAKVISWFFPIRTVISTHAVYRLPQRPILARIIKWLLSSFDEILAVSETSKTELIQIGLDENKIKVHKNWVDLTKFFPKDRNMSKKQLKLSGKVILFVGRMIEKKGLGFLLKASEKFKKITFIFIGDGPMKEVVLEYIRRSNNIIYGGRLRQEKEDEQRKLINYYRAADIFATIPTYEEGFGAVYLESLACGTPVLTSNLGSLPTFLDTSVARLINPTQKEVDRAISEIFAEKDTIIKKMQKSCRPYAEKHFSDKNAEVIYNSYDLDLS